MKSAKLILSLITVLFALLGLLQIMSFDAANPIMLTSLATLLVLRGVEYKKSRSKSKFVITALTALFVYAVVIYNVFLG